MELRYYPDPILRGPTETVREFDAALAALAEEMIRAMHEFSGLGLAAPQVGIGRRIAVITPDDQPGREIVLVNPELLESSGWVEDEEGCLSFPGVYIKIGRFVRVRIRHQDVQGAVREMEAEGLLARAIQHELDHLDGRLLVDRMSSVQRMAQRRRLNELQERYDRRITRAETGSEAAR